MLMIFALSIISCKKKGREYKTDSGFKYILYTEGKGQKPQLGDYVTIELVYRTQKDSVLFDSRKNQSPMRFKLERIPFQGSYEEGLTFLSVGDSATFYVPADSLYEFYYKNKETRIQQSATVFTPHSFLLFDVKLIRVQDYVEAEQEQMMLLSSEEKNEKELLTRFLFDKDFKPSPDSGIYYYRKIKSGTGKPVRNGKFVTVQYTGKFLNGEVFDYSGTGGKPVTFVSGARQVIQGWEFSILGMREGDRSEILIPSKYAYGSDGLRNASTGSYKIPPFTPLIYDLEVMSVEDTLRLVKK